MTPEEILHKEAARFASNRLIAYMKGMASGDVEKKTKNELEWIYIAHYEGYREGYWVATGDKEFSTDPAKQEKNHEND
jgi:hypothetical protein